jgi:hypothetical protein
VARPHRRAVHQPAPRLAAVNMPHDAMLVRIIIGGEGMADEFCLIRAPSCY